jgi:hypothetical protein
MYAVIIQVKVDRDREDTMRAMINDEVVPSARQLPGLIGGTWFRSLKGDGATAVMLFGSEEAACAAAQLFRARGSLAERPVWSLHAIGTYEVLARA